MTNQPLRWWYFVWNSLSNEASGAQMLPIAGEFDFLYAQNWIEQTNKGPGFISFFREVSIAQVAQYKVYTDKYAHERSGGKIPKFAIIRGGKES
jgi:hypothetical protein